MLFKMKIGLGNFAHSAISAKKYLSATNAIWKIYNLKNNFMFRVNVYMCTKSTRRLYLFSKTNDKILTVNETEVVYEIPCECGEEYIGQTKQILKR